MQNKVLEGESVDVIRWSATGDAIYFTKKGETTDLWKFRIDPEIGRRVSDPTPILSGFKMGWGFSVSGDGRKLAYLRVEDHSNLWLAEKAPGGSRGETNQRKLTTGTLLRLDPCNSPDGRTVAFSQGTAEKSNIFTMPIEGGPPRQVSFLEGECRSPAWSPDGKQIAFVSDHGGRSHVWIGGASGGTPRAIETTKALVGVGSVRWAPGHGILYVTPSGKFETVRLLDPVTGKEDLLTPNSSAVWIRWPAMSPDRSVIAATSTAAPPTYDWGLRLFPLEGGDPKRILEGLVFPVAWSADGAAV